MATYQWYTDNNMYEGSLRGDFSHTFVSEECLEFTDDESLFKALTKKFGSSGQLIRLKCIRCGNVIPLSSCSNCDFCAYTAGHTSSGSAGLFCQRCERGFTTWTCKKCDTVNPVSKSMIHLSKSSGCFVATAVYESYDAPNVLVLRTFRDNVLIKSYFGRIFVHLYYLVSPPFAKFISHRKKLKNIIREFILDPVVKIINKRFEKKDL